MKTENPIMSFVKSNAWAIIIVTASVVAQWSVFSTRLTNIEARQDRQDIMITSLQQGQALQQANYAALNAKLDSLTDNVLYIRTRIDSVH